MEFLNVLTRSEMRKISGGCSAAANCMLSSCDPTHVALVFGCWQSACLTCYGSTGQYYQCDQQVDAAIDAWSDYCSVASSL